MPQFIHVEFVVLEDLIWLEIMLCDFNLSEFPYETRTKESNTCASQGLARKPPWRNEGEGRPQCSLEGMMLKLKLQYFGYSCEELTHWKRL